MGAMSGSSLLDLHGTTPKPRSPCCGLFLAQGPFSQGEPGDQKAMDQLPEWYEVVEVDFPPVGPITKETTEQVLANPKRFRGSVRVSTGRIWEDAEFGKRRDRVDRTPLP